MGGFGAYDLARLYPGTFCAVGGDSAALWRNGGESAQGAFDNAEDFARHDVIGAARGAPIPIPARRCGWTSAAKTRSGQPIRNWRRSSDPMAVKCSSTSGPGVTTSPTGAATGTAISPSTPMRWHIAASRDPPCYYEPLVNKGHQDADDGWRALKNRPPRPITGP